MTQFGATIKNPIGSNLESTFARQQELRARIEEIKEFQRVKGILQSHLDGKISALSVSYIDIVKDPAILDMVTPVSREPDFNGKIILWEGYTTPKPDFFSGKPAGDRGPLHRVVQHADGHRAFCRYNSVVGQWIICTAKDADGNIVNNRFPAPVYRRKKAEQWGDVGGEVIARTVMKPNGETERRVFQANISPTTVKR